MILVRNVIQAKFGKGGELAALMVQGMTGFAGQWRVLTDLSSGPFDTVVIEWEAESLAEWEQRRERMFADPGFAQAVGQTVDLGQAGHAELYTVLGQGQ